MPIVWSDWHADAFLRAREEAKPVLLSIAASWCRGCREMDRTSYADPRVERLVHGRFVAVRVDADRRPDIAERYGLGGLPTTAFLTAEGDVVAGGTFVSPDRMLAGLEQIVVAFATRGDEIAARAQEAGGQARDRRETAPPDHDALLAGVFRTYDADHGGFGTEPKFPVMAPLHLALGMSESSPLRSIAGHTLDAMADGGLHDRVNGGFFRCAASRDWGRPHHEKLLDVNAGLLRLAVDAAAELGAPRFAALARDVAGYLQTWLADPVEGGWAGSQEADSGYYDAATAADRAARAAPPVDRTRYAGWNGVMASAALHAADALQDAALGEFAIASLERVLLSCYQPGSGVAHYADGRASVRGLLEDQIAMAAACLDAAEATGRIPYEMMAEELAHYVVRTMWDAREGGVFDRAHGDQDVGRLRNRVKPFVSNCEAARLFARLAAASGNHDFADRARETLAAIAPLAATQGPLAAHYLLAVREAGLR